MTSLALTQLKDAVLPGSQTLIYLFKGVRQGGGKKTYSSCLVCDFQMLLSFSATSDFLWSH